MIEMLNDAGRLWAAYFVPAMVQNTLFLLLVFAALYWFRNAPAGVKYAIAAVGLVKLLLPPFVPTSVISPAGSEQVAFPASTLLFSFTNLSAGADAVPPDTPAGLDVLGALFIVWAVVAAWIVARAVRSTHRLVLGVRGATPIAGEPAIDAATARESRRIGVFKSSSVGMPLTIGVMPHRIYVPASWERWTPECRRAILRHEIAHIRRRDGLFQSLEILAQAFYFFHPLVWMLNRRLRAFREMACDDASVGRDRRSKLSYSKLLVEMAETALRPPVACESASALMRRKHDLLARVAYQVKEGDMMILSKKKMAVIMAALIVSILPLSMYVGAADTSAPSAAEAGTKKASSDYPAVHIALRGDVIMIDGNKTTEDSFRKHLEHATQEAMKGTDQKPVVEFSCDGDVSMASLFKVQEQLLDMGLVKVSYDDNIGNDLPVVLPDEKLIRKMKELPDEDICHVKIAADGQLYFGEKKYSPDKATKHIEQCMAKNPHLVVSIHMDGKTTYDDFVKTLSTVKKTGCQRIFVNNPIG
ncbi:MAG: M56 family metallopeptidase [Candidatus Latescibacterota bacterium]|jgi:beta-lactamase regulating signal transducer with metallopeptidase domain